MDKFLADVPKLPRVDVPEPPQFGLAAVPGFKEATQKKHAGPTQEIIGELQLKLDEELLKYPNEDFTPEAHKKREEELNGITSKKTAALLEYQKKLRLLTVREPHIATVQEVSYNVRALRNEIAVLRPIVNANLVKKENKEKRDRARHEQNQAIAASGGKRQKCGMSPTEEWEDLEEL